jgi:hypothetical protein
VSLKVLEAVVTVKVWEMGSHPTARDTLVSIHCGWLRRFSSKVLEPWFCYAA